MTGQVRADLTVLDEVAKVADAVLFEGYLLYPYRASAQKNRLRWQFGVLTPAGFGGEPSATRTECLLEPGPDAALHVRLRFLQLQTRTVRARSGIAVDELAVDGQRHIPWEEGLPREVDAVLAVDELRGAERVVPFRLPGEVTSEPLTDSDGASHGTVERRCWPLSGRLRISAEELPGPYDVLRLRLVVENAVHISVDPAAHTRELALRESLIAAHSLVAVATGSFVSMTDGPEWAAPAVAGCVNEHTWPVLAGPPERSDLLLSSPIILADHPQLAPESPTDLFDGTEIDEILSLRTLVLTDEEKAEARATDPRAAAVVDAVESMPPEIFERLHGAIRSLGPSPAVEPEPGRPAEAAQVPWWDPAADDSVDPDTDHVLVGDVAVAKGSRVVLRPRGGGDAQDTFLVGLTATVQAVLNDVDGDVHLAVSVDGDPAAELQIAHGRFRYFRPDEVEVLR